MRNRYIGLLIIPRIIPEYMGQIRTDQKYIARFKSPYIITCYNFSFAAKNQRKLNLGVLMQVVVKMLVAILLQTERLLGSLWNFEW
jgi:hypothetical protein